MHVSRTDLEVSGQVIYRDHWFDCGPIKEILTISKNNYGNN